MEAFRTSEITLSESEERYRRLVEFSPFAVSIYKDDTFVYVNPAGMKIVGVKQPEEIIGTTLLDWVHPKDHDLAREQLENAIRYGHASSREYKIIQVDGPEVDVSATAIYDSKSSSFELVFEDITARKVAERALSESEELNRRLVELSPEAIALHYGFEFQYVNPACLSLFGAASLDDIIGRSIFDIIHPDYKEAVASRLAKVYEQSITAQPAEQKIVRLDGTVVDVEVIATSIPFMGRHAILTLIRDITERKKTEEHRIHAEQMIRQSEERYFRLQTSLDRFSHELFGVMKIGEMDFLLVKEVCRIIHTDHVSLVEIDRNDTVAIKCGSLYISNRFMKDILKRDPRQLPLCELIEMREGYCLKIGETMGKSRLLCIAAKPPNLTMTPKRVWLKTITRYVSVLYDNFRLIEDLTNELEHTASKKSAPSWLLRLLFNLTENERKRQSQDLHDAALQEQIIWYRRLEDLKTLPAVPDELRQELSMIAEGLLDVIYQIRITCNELRPPMLKEFGLVASLESLFETTQLRSDYEIVFDSDGFAADLSDEQLIGLYRIVQELLANAGKHADADTVQLALSTQLNKVELIYGDNGKGLPDNMQETGEGIGIYGIKERIRSLGGHIEFESLPGKGLHIFISIPVPVQPDEERNTTEGKR